MTSVRSWLLCVWLLVFAIVVVGGITRLTGSGLSITRWQPITGVLPPLSEEAWQAELEHYRASPQFEQVNRWMELADFKRIYFWEYVHRLLGRVIGFAVLLPLIYFWARKRLTHGLAWKAVGLLVMGGLQGVLGWYMVKSGLVDEPRVSHYRLAAHLLLAFLVGQLVLWVALEAGRLARAQDQLTDRAGPRAGTNRAGPRAGAAPDGSPARSPVLGAGDRMIARATWALLALLALQTLYGAFMAGTRAGYYFGTFPDMAGRFAPQAFFTASTLAQNLLDHPPAIHWIHRVLAFVVLAWVFGLWVLVQRVSTRNSVRRAATLLAVVTFAQLNLGAITVLTRVHLPWAVAHQGLGYLLLSAATLTLHRVLRASTR